MADDGSSAITTKPRGNSNPLPGVQEVGGLGANVRQALGKLTPELRKRVLAEAARSGGSTKASGPRGSAKK
jgi:hypothetical protein